jgi:hypothetical protein
MPHESCFTAPAIPANPPEHGLHRESGEDLGREVRVSQHELRPGIHQRRRTFAIISHPDAGKTTLTEKLLLKGGAIRFAGAVRARGESGARGRTG